jgi:colanic acid biosynthesis glycosyl transferase WcaI
MDLRAYHNWSFLQQRMRVLIMHMRYRPDATGTGPLVTELAEDLASSGEDVTVVTSVPHYGRRQIPDEYRGRLIYKSLESGVSVRRTFSPVGHYRSTLGRGVDYAAYTALAGLSGIALGQVDVVLCVAPPITVSVSGWAVSLVRDCPVVFNAQDIWPDGLIQMGRIRSQAVIACFKWIERITYRKAARITVVSQGMRDNLLAKGVEPGRIEVIPNWVDTDRVQPVGSLGRFRTKHELNGKFVVLFSGNVGFAAGLDSVLEAAGHLRDEPRIVFLIVGEGSAKQALLHGAEAAGLRNVKFVTTQPTEDFPDMLASCDIGLVPLKKQMGSLSVPSKILAFMAAGRPILASVPDDSDVRRIVTEARCGVVVPAEDPRALAGAVRSLVAKTDLLETYGQNARWYAMANFSRRNLTGRYHALLLEVAGMRGDGIAG